MMADLKAAMALLAFNPDTDCKKYRVSGKGYNQGSGKLLL